ncbi:MAG: hypothetical protein H7317_03580 [Pseudorhodobacter sp.]|nr:hypothetical protein [Pseudorhodobacter sp.]
MAKEWDKFQSDYKKLAPRIEKYSAANASTAKTRINSANTNCGEGERFLADCMIVARKNGVTGTTLVDFVKDKTFADGYKQLKTATNMMAEELLALQEFSKEAALVLAEVTKLEAAVAKDLKGRKDKSESKKDIEALQEKLAVDAKSLKEAAGKSDAVEPLKKNLPAKFPDTVAKILKQAPDAQEKRQDAEMLPMLLVDRNLKSNLSKALNLGKTITAEIQQALDDAADDMVKAAGRIKTAAVQLKALGDLNTDYQKLKTANKRDIEISKDKDKIETAIDAIEKTYKTAESKVRGAATTLKKAG